MNIVLPKAVNEFLKQLHPLKQAMAMLRPILLLHLIAVTIGKL